VEVESLYRRALQTLDRYSTNDQKLVTVLTNYSLLLHRIGRRGEAKELEARARSISTAPQSDWGHTVDGSH